MGRWEPSFQYAGLEPGGCGESLEHRCRGESLEDPEGPMRPRDRTASLPIPSEGRGSC